MDPETTSLLEFLAAATLLAGIVLYAFIENGLNRLSRVDVKLLLERRKDLATDSLVALLPKGKFRLQIPLQFFLRLLLVLWGLVIHSMLLRLGAPQPLLLTLLATGLLIMLLTQWLPWTMSEEGAVRVFTRLLTFLRPVYLLFYPVTYPVVGMVARRQLADLEADSEEDEVSEEEVQAFLDVGEEEGIFEGEQSRIIQQVVEFGETIVREIMVPRTGIVAIADTATQEELKSLMVVARHSRIPVYKDTIDAIVGVAYVRDLLAVYSPGSPAQPITGLIREAFFVPETKPVSDLLPEMQAQGEHMAIVVDEYGGVAGLVTLEDLLEEIVGEIRDEDQPEEKDIQPEDGGTFLINGDAELDDIAAEMGVELYEESYNTIAGIIIKHLGRFPAQNETLAIGPLEIQVLDVDNRKIKRVRARRLHDES